MWLRKGDNLVLVPEHMPETIARCLGDGWVEAPDPRVVTIDTLEPVAAAQPIAEPEPDVPVDLRVSSWRPRAQRGRR